VTHQEHEGFHLADRRLTRGQEGEEEKQEGTMAYRHDSVLGRSMNFPNKMHPPWTEH